MLQLYHHVLLEHNPERLGLDDSMAKSTRFGVNKIIIIRVGDNIEAYPSRPLMAFLPKRMPQSARRLRFLCQLGSQRQQSSIGLPGPHEK
ncbi:hypothetical protein ACFX2F_017338 [Malus domestica]